MRDRAKEIEFSQKRHHLQHEIIVFVGAYVKEAEIEIVERSCMCAGICHPNTLEGHDIALEYHLQDSKIPKQSEVIGIRIRHEHWRPKITIWGRKSMMESFLCDDLSEEVKNKLMDCIDKTITQI